MRALGCTWNRLFQKQNQNQLFVPAETRDHYWDFAKVCDRCGHDFIVSASPRSYTKSIAYFTSFAGHTGQYDSRYVTFKYIMLEVFVADTGGGILGEQACICSVFCVICISRAKQTHTCKPLCHRSAYRDMWLISFAHSGTVVSRKYIRIHWK